MSRGLTAFVVDQCLVPDFGGYHRARWRSHHRRPTGFCGRLTGTYPVRPMSLSLKDSVFG